MAQSAGPRKKQIIILAVGGALSLALAAAHFYSTVARRLASNSDVELLLLHPEKPVLFVYHPGSATVNAVRLPKKAVRGAGSAVQRAHSALGQVLKWGSGVGNAAFYIEAGEPDLEAFYEVLNGWRGRPGQLFGMAARLRELKNGEKTNLSSHDLLLLFLELTRLNSSSFVVSELPKNYFDKPGADGEPEPEETGEVPAPSGAKLEVLNASGRKDLAEQVMRYLRKKGFDVINYGNYGAVQKQTKIVNCSGNIAAARQVREALGLKGLEIYSKPEKPAVVQARVILGTDFNAAGTADPEFFGAAGRR